MNDAPEIERHRPGRARQDADWERKTLEKLAFAALNEQRRARRWGIFFRILGFAYVGFLLVTLTMPEQFDADQLRDRDHTAVVDLKGVIVGDTEAAAAKVKASLQAAFEDERTKGVVLRIDSPGGSPVQAGMIRDEILRLRKAHPDTKLYAVVEDLCASGGYYVASAADGIYVDKASLVGSIGVIMSGFGFTEAMDDLGVDNRTMTAGKYKAFLDPFSPEDPKAKAHAQTMLDAIHRQFIDVVKIGRGVRLADAPDLFTGLLWTGDRSVELGLADGLGDMDYVAREIVKVENTVEFTPKRDYLERFADRFGAGVGAGFARWFGLDGGIH